ncbi:aminotransferase class I/II-fold pyridoxal phosphate-dependent enzyme [Corynebacterium suedekumii]|nr:aminotransferase class I/II-fold pyridoxal phosphate-dependent enzyme [Corynebacterium suedekumii]
MSGREVSRLRDFGETVFATMTARAIEFDAVNLGQGFPDTDGPERMLEIAGEQIRGGNNQYGPGRGLPELREAVAAQRARDYDVTYDPASEVLITVGATEAISATVLGLVEPGSEVIVLEPYYDAYAAAIALAGATRVPVPLVADGDTWTVDVDAVRAAVTSRTAMIIINSPHNPTGAVFGREVLARLAALCVERDLLVLSDEVYEICVSTSRTPPSPPCPACGNAPSPSPPPRESFNVTGWKTGWALAPAPLLDAVLKAKQFMSYVGVTPVQPAIAHALVHESAWLADMVAGLATNRDLLGAALRDAGFGVHATAGTYFTVADIAPLGYTDGVEFCLDLPERPGSPPSPSRSSATIPAPG